MARVKVLKPIKFGEKELAAGRVLRIADSSLAAMQEKYGDAVAEWVDWPNRAKEPQLPKASPRKKPTDAK